MAILRHIRMFRRTHHRLLVWLLPLLLLQSFVPTGYMLTTGQRGLEVAFCPVQSAATLAVLNRGAAQTHDAHAGHAGHQSHDNAAAQDHSQHARSSSCPFALAGAPVPVATLSTVTLVLVPVRSPPPIATVALDGVLLFERNRIRGPPHFA